MIKLLPKVTKIRKRDGRIVPFNLERVINAIYSGGKASGEFGKKESEKLARSVRRVLNKKYDGLKIPTVEEIQDVVEEILMKKGWHKTARAYILYRNKRARLRRAKLLLKETTKLVKDYIAQADWRVKENANMAYSLQGLNNHIASSVIARYWLQEIYPAKAARTHIEGDFHIHDLSFLGAYCFDDQTRVLTKEGFKFFKDVTRQDKIATYNLKTGYLEYQKPEDRQVFDYSGFLFVFENRSLNLKVTPEHRLLVREKGEKVWKFVTPSGFKSYSEFLKQMKWKGKEIKFFSLPIVKGGNRLKHLKRIPIKDYLKFMGWYLSEGSAWINRRKDRRLPDYIISFGQNDKENRKEIASLIRKLGFSPNLSEKDHIQFGSKELCLYLKKFGTSKEKYIPNFIKNLSPELIKIFLFALFAGDGTIENGNLRKYYTVSQRLVEDVLECLLKIGQNGSIHWNGKKYTLSVERRQLTPIYKDLPQKIPYQGKVYDLTVPNGTLIVERNGRVVVSGNCVGWDLYDLLVSGFRGVPGKIQSRPAKHFKVALGQAVNFLYTMQGESAGANALSNFDTLLAPFIAYDQLDYSQVKQGLQEFLYNMNVPTRVGFQSPFTNVTFDLVVPLDFANQPVIIGGKTQKRKYGEFQKEMDMFNKAFAEVMLEGDARGRVFSFPIPTYNLTSDFNWSNPTIEPIFEMSAKYGIPYWANFVNSDMKPEETRSMCCRLRLDLSELIKRGGGLFGANALTGCYDQETEILTENGWKLFRNLTKKDKVFTLTKESKIELHQPKRLFEYDWDGEMYQFKARSFDLLVTPNHRMVVDASYKVRKFVEAQDFDVNNHRIPKKGLWEGEEKEWFILPTISFTKYGRQGRTSYKVTRDSLKIKMDSWLKFFGIWLAEGSTDNEKISSKHGYRVFVTQTSEKKREEIKKALDELPFSYYEEDRKHFVICNKQLWQYLRQFGNCYTKFIPKEIKTLSKRQLSILFKWLVKGDGHIRKTTGQINYYTSSKKLADDIQEIILKLGYLSTLTSRKGRKAIIRGREIKGGVNYCLGVQKTRYYVFRKRNIKRVDYNGKVYCCEVKNHTVLVRRNGRICWSGNSIGVVTLNMSRIGFLANSEQAFLNRVGRLMEIAKDALEVKRKVVERFTENGLYPYSKFYLRGNKERLGGYWAGHFSTIGLNGLNEGLLNLMGKNIASKAGREFAVRVLTYMREKLVNFQRETGNLYNLEATPAEGTSYRLAKIDKERYPKIIVANEKEARRGAAPFYTNSSQLPVDHNGDLFDALKLQDELQCQYTGGTVFHVFLGERMASGQEAKVLAKKIVDHFSLPYFSFTPTFSICPNCGYLEGIAGRR